MTDALSVGLGDVVQITNEKHQWFGCLLVVSEVKGWGVLAYCLIPKSNLPNGEAPGGTGHLRRVP
jgi:hypothetical protein